MALYKKPKHAALSNVR